MMIKIRGIVLFFTVALFIGLSTAGQANAFILTFDLDMEYSGGTAPSGPAPWTSTLVPDPVSSILFIAGALTLGFRRFCK